MKLEKITMHPQYDDLTMVNDIAVIFLANEIRWSSCVGPACLPCFYPYTTFAGACCCVIGFGCTEFASPTSKYLLEGNVKAIENSACCKDFPHITENHLCVLPFNTPNSKNQYPDACQADSGGPLLWMKGPRLFLIGVVSYGKACGLNYSSVYTRVTKYCDWIKQVTGATFHLK